MYSRAGAIGSPVLGTVADNNQRLEYFAGPGFREQPQSFAVARKLSPTRLHQWKWVFGIAGSR